MSRPRALVVDDEADIRELLELTLERMEVDSTSVPDLASALAEARANRYDLCLTDMRLPDGSGIDLVRFMQEHCPTVPIAMITAHGNMEAAIEALKAGAFDFLSKPLDLQVLRNLVRTALQLGSRSDSGKRRLVGSSAEMEEVRAKVAKLARSQAPVLVSGESGTGKELVARLIHDRGPRADHPFVPVNCGAIPQELMESELFGHKRGSFTGAVADKPGLFQAAEGGTLFLDEVAELPLAMQVKLLRAIQEKSVRSVGAAEEVPVDVRILSASHRDLAARVADGAFRQDLYYRLNVINLHVPALRERRADVLELADDILGRMNARGAAPGARLSTAAADALRTYDFPGNVRELENILERAVTLCEADLVGAEDLGLTAARTVDARDGSVEAGGDLDSVLEDVERRTILEALEQARWNKTATARRLGISFGALRYRMQKLGLE